MKKTKKLFVGLALSALVLTGCNGNNSGANEPGQFRQQEIYKLYRTAGGDMTYEQWLETVRGADGSAIYADGSDPAAAAGKEGDMFINISTWDLFLKINGNWAKICNLKGEKGDQGEKGDKGDKGDQGEKGEPGSQFYCDAGTPNNNAARDGDYYLDLETMNLFLKVNGAWANVGNIRGDQGVAGADGATFYANAGDPSNDLGKNGDMYVNRTSWDLFTKVGNEWINLGSIKGEKGEAGSAIYCDAVNPADSAGRDGDLFINISTWDLLIKVDGSWQNVTNIKGEKGDKGDKGDQGEQGEQGNSVLNGYGRPADTLGRDGDSYIDILSFDFFVKRNGHWFKEANMRKDSAWRDDVSAKMFKYFGRALPFADFNESSLTYTLTFEGSYEYLSIYDTNPVNVLDNYADKLLAEGYTYSSSWNQYYISCPGFKTPWVEFGYDAENTANYIKVEFSPFQDEVYLYDVAGYSYCSAWPQENIALTMGEDFAQAFVGGVTTNNLLEKMEIKNEGDHYDEYRVERLAIEGDFVDQLSAQVLAAGFHYDSDNGIYLDEKGDREVSFSKKDGFTRINLFGAYANDYDAAYFLSEGFDQFDGFPADVVAELYPSNAFEGANNDNAWFVSRSDEYVSYYQQRYYSAILATEGDFVEELEENILAAGFAAGSAEGSYRIDGDHYLTISFARGCTVLNLSAWVDEEFTAEAMAESIEGFFADYYDIDVTVPVYDAADPDVVFEVDDYYVSSVGVYLAYVDPSDATELNAYFAKAQQAGWNVVSGQYGDNAIQYGDSGECATIEMWIQSGYCAMYCYVMEAPEAVTVSEAFSAVLEYWEEDYDFDPSEIALPLYETANGSCVLDDSYTTAEDPFYLVQINGTTADELAAFITALETAGWTVDRYESESGSGYSAIFGESGLCPAFEIHDSNLATAGSIVILFYAATPVEKVTAAEATENVLAYWAEEGVETTDLPLPDYATAAGSFITTDAYVESKGFYLVEIKNTTTDELAAYIQALTAAGWSVQDKSSDGYYAVSYGNGENCPAFEIHLEDLASDGVVDILYYTKDVASLDEITPLSVMQYVASEIGFPWSWIDELGEDSYRIYNGFSSDDYSEATVKGWFEGSVPEGFALDTAWHSATLKYFSTVTGESAKYYDEESGVVIEFYVGTWSTSTATYTVFEIYTYYAF